MNRKLGGAEQAFLDYARALTSEDNQVINITSSFARINEKLPSVIPNLFRDPRKQENRCFRFLRSRNKFGMTNNAFGMTTNSIKLPNLFPWCIISKIYLKLLILIHKPDLIIAHGGRAVNFSCSLGNHLVPVVGVTHSYSIKHILKCDYIIALDEALKNHLASHGYQESKIFIVPNMVDVNKCHPEGGRKTDRKDPEKKITGSLSSQVLAQDDGNWSTSQNNTTIGAMGRFVPEKGFNYLIEAISILKKKNYNVKLKLGGSGPLETELRKLVDDLELQENVEFIGWVGADRHPPLREGTSSNSCGLYTTARKNLHLKPKLKELDTSLRSGSQALLQDDKKTTFFQSIDIFCIPSTFETFGIVALESMSHNIPTIVTNTGGLKTIVEHGVDGLVAEAASSRALADKIAELIDNPEMAQILRQNAYQKILSTYAINVVKKNLSKILEDILR